MGWGAQNLYSMGHTRQQETSMGCGGQKWYCMGHKRQQETVMGCTRQEFLTMACALRKEVLVGRRCVRVATRAQGTQQKPDATNAWGCRRRIQRAFSARAIVPPRKTRGLRHDAR